MIDVDRYHREVGRIYLGERFINMEMVRDGFAWRYVRYDKPGEFAEAEADAASTGGDCGLLRIRCRRGSGGAKSGARRRALKTLDAANQPLWPFSISPSSPTSRSRASSTPPASRMKCRPAFQLIRSAAPENDPSWLPSPHEANDWSFVGFPRLPAGDGTRLGRITPRYEARHAYQGIFLG